MLGTIALCLLLGIAGAVVPGVQADKDQEVEREIKALELHLALLLVRGELDTYSTFLSQDYTRINDRGEVQSREQVLEQFRTRALVSRWSRRNSWFRAMAIPQFSRDSSRSRRRRLLVRNGQAASARYSFGAAAAGIS
jgi:hypothetical protein